MTQSTLVILGDSTSMTAGVERETYPFHMARKPIWKSGTRILNCSIPGFTSADAAAFYFRNKTTFGRVVGVIIYLGNCDTMATELVNKRYSRVKDAAARLLVGKEKRAKKTRLRNKLLHYQWNSEFDRDAESPTSIADFEHNIGSVIRDCKKENIPIVLVNPVAHVNFPAGVGKGNFIFYHYLGLDARVAEKVSIEDKRFVGAMRAFEAGDFSRAASSYRNILSEAGPLSAVLEYQTLTAHNYAIAAARDGRLAEARYLLPLLARERGARGEIILYNLAILEALAGDRQAYEAGLREAYEADQSMYRARAPYRRALAQMSGRHSNVTLVDLADLVSDQEFVDHCHPLPHVQARIGGAITEAVDPSVRSGSYRSTIENRLFNPEYAQGNELEFHDYFNSYAKIAVGKLEGHIADLRNAYSSVGRAGWSDQKMSGGLAACPAEIQQAFDYYQRHPVFPDRRYVVLANPNWLSDVGRFPEFFFYRFLIPFLREVEADDNLRDLFAARPGLLRSSSELMNVLPERARAQVATATPDWVDGTAEDWADAILNRVGRDLRQHIAAGNQVRERLVSTIFWYFRESLRFGSHSRVTMRYDRVILEYAAEALAVAALLDRTSGRQRTKIKNMIAVLLDLAAMHDSYCTRYLPGEDNEKLLRDYDAALDAFLARLGAVSSSGHPTAARN